MQALRRIHSSTGHCSKEYLVKALRRRNATPHAIELARQFRRASCEERRDAPPRKQASVEDIPPKWSKIQVDGASWIRPETKEPFHFLLGIDEGSRFRRGKILKKGKKISLTGEDLLNIWRSIGNLCLVPRQW